MLYPDEVKRIKFFMLGNDDNIKDSSVEVTEKDLFSHLLPIPGGIYDPHMGTTEHNWKCQTCFNTKQYCPGHSGHIMLNYPVQSHMFKDEIITWLKAICFKCGNLLTNNAIKLLMNIKNDKKLSSYVKSIRSTNKNITCMKCEEIQPYFVRDKNRIVTIWAEIYDGNRTESKKQIFNHEIADTFDRVSEETVIILGKTLPSHPRKLILNILRVPPNTIRPDIKRISGGRTNNDDLTTFIKTCVEINNNIPVVLPSVIDNVLESSLSTLDMMVHEMIRGSPASSSKNKVITNNNKQPSSLQLRIQGKPGRIRMNLMGKRIGYSGRAFITCDANMKIDDLGIPLSMAKNIQIPETVNSRNRDLLLIYFNNKRNIYPGCTKVIKKKNGIEYYVSGLHPGFVLEEGDIIMRDLVDGDVVIFNRQPTMLPEGMTCHRIIVMKEGNTLRMNISACVLYNADFDGDAMNVLFPTSIQAINEIKNIANVGSTFISKATGEPLLGCLQDSLLSTVLLTHTKTVLDKKTAMSIFKYVPLDFDKESYTGRELISMLLPSINYEGIGMYYNESYAPYIRYRSDEVKVIIRNGIIIQGILDGKALGEKRHNTLFHLINNEYGPKRALDVMYKIQQIGISYLEIKGFTVNIDHANVNEESQSKIVEKTNTLLLESKRITDKLIRGEIIPRIGSTVSSFYEQLQIESLRLADDFVEPVINGIDTATNSLYIMVHMCKKGNSKNFQAMTSAIGSTLVDGKRVPKTFGYERTLPYYTRYNLEPESNGFVRDSYISGVQPDVFLLTTYEARTSIINRVLSTSVSGMYGREGVNNLESVIINNIRQCVKHRNIIQFMYGNNGVDVRRIENVKILTATISDAVLEQKYHSKTSMFDKAFHNKNVQKLLDDEFEEIKKGRARYREIIGNASHMFLGVSISGDIHLPVNIKRIIDDMLYKYKDTKATNIDPVKTITLINNFCEAIHYVYYNNIQERKKSHIPDVVRSSMEFAIIYIRSYLNTSYIVANSIGITILELIMKKIRYVILKSLIDYGTSIGVLAAQAMTEPLTQYTISSHHRVGIGGGDALPEVDKVVRYNELMTAKATSQLALATMTLYLKEEYEEDLVIATDISIQIEKIQLRSFLSRVNIFFEDYKKPIHPDFKYEIKMITDYEKHNPNIRIPSDLIKWVIRLEFSKIKMIIKDMDLESILFKLSAKYNYLFLVNTNENDEEVIIRCYIRGSSFRKGHVITQKDIENLKDGIINTVIRGTSGVNNTNVSKLQKFYIKEDGAVNNKSIYVIKTQGTNILSTFENENIDEYKSYSNSITEIEEIYGIEAARYLLRTELEKVVTGRNQAHYSIIADEMCYTGTYTGMSKAGLERREPDNILLRAAYSHASAALRSGSVDTKSSDIYGVSTPLTLGQTPSIGSTYNSVSVDFDFIKNNTKSVDDILDEL